MKANSFQIMYAACCLLLLVSCSNNAKQKDQNAIVEHIKSGEAVLGEASKKPTLGASDDALGLCCWFVEDDGVGHSGYAVLDASGSAAYPRGGGLFGTIEEVRDAINRQKVKTPWLIPCYGGDTPPGWKIRRLTTNEVERLGLLEFTVWGQR
jgi:hypothetical protein